MELNGCYRTKVDCEAFAIHILTARFYVRKGRGSQQILYN